MAEGTAVRGHQGRISKVRMIEHVKHLSSELQIESLRHLRVLGYREIGI
jgi:hypothetical protein